MNEQLPPDPGAAVSIPIGEWNLAQLALVLDHVQWMSGGAWLRACCPTHDDGHRSFSANVKMCNRRNKEAVFFTCHAGCTQKEIVNELRRRATVGVWDRAVLEDGDPDTEPLGPIEAYYTYTDHRGNPLHQMRRHAGKRMRLWHAGPAGWQPGGGGVPHQLYRRHQLAALSEQAPVFLVEGEKDADTLVGIGLEATTKMCGAKTAWRDHYSDTLKGKQVLVIPDHDIPGWECAERCTKALLSAGIKAWILPLWPDEAYPRQPKHGYDVTDWVNAWRAANRTDQDIKDLLVGFAKQIMEVRPQLDTPFQLLEVRNDMSELEAMDPGEWLIEGVMKKNTVTVTVGETNVGKTVLGLDQKMCILTGIDWHGQAVVSGPVVWVAGEGVENLAALIRGWRHEHPDVKMLHSMFVLPNAVNFQDPAQLNDLIVSIRARCPEPIIICIDTLSKNFGGGDENNTGDMQQFVNQGCHRLRTEFNCTVEVFHHTGWNTDRERGNAVLRSDSETVWHIEHAGEHLVQFRNVKVKGMPMPDRRFGIERRVGMWTPPGSQETQTYDYAVCIDVAQPGEAQNAAAESPTARRQRLIFESLYERSNNSARHQGMRDIREWVQGPYLRHNAIVAQQDPPGTEWRVPSERTIQRDLQGMVEAGWIARVEGERADGRDITYTLTTRGLAEAIRILSVELLDQLHSMIPQDRGLDDLLRNMGVEDGDHPSA